MKENLPVPVKQQLPAVIKDARNTESIAIVNYEKLDSAYYSFSFSFDDDSSFQMNEGEKTVDQTDFVEADYSEEVPESHKIYYSAAVASGVFTGMLSTVKLSTSLLVTLDQFNEDTWKPIITGSAKLAGYKGNDYKGAVKFLFPGAKKNIEKIKKNEKTKEYLSLLAEHSSLVGFVFSVITQYSRKEIYINDEGAIIKKKLPGYYVIGETDAEKLICAFFYWVFALAVNKAESNRDILENMRMPEGILEIIKTFTDMPFLKIISTDSEEVKRIFSEWLRKIIKNTKSYKKDDAAKGRPYLDIMGFAFDMAEDAFLVLINECIVRSMFVLIRICSAVKEQKITSFEDFSEIPASEMLRPDDRLLSRMHLLASMSFASVNVGGAVIKALKNKKVNNRDFAKTFFGELNIVGIGRFIFACAADSRYWGEDIQILFRRREKTKDSVQEAEELHFEDHDVFESLMLDATQARLLYSLESIAVSYDIQHTKKEKTAAAKQLWAENWKKRVLDGMKISNNLASQYFVVDEDQLYDGIYSISKDKSNWNWFYLLTQELVLFKPYFPLDCPDDHVFKKLKTEADYVEDHFVRRQTITSQNEVDTIKKAYSKYYGYLSGSTQGKIIGMGATAAVAVATGGIAFAFAPGIAVAIAGEAVAGLHGAALTSASLALVGGGSLAAGGLGMAGGTAIITGGGALLGLAGTGTTSALTILLQTPSSYWVGQSAKLLTYCKCILAEALNDKSTVKTILSQIETSISSLEQEIDKINSDKNDLDKPLVKNTEEYLKYLKKCRTELRKIVKGGK